MDRTNSERGDDERVRCKRFATIVCVAGAKISIKLSHNNFNVYRTLSRNSSLSLETTTIHTGTIPIHAPIDADWHASTLHARVAWNRAERHRLTDWLTRGCYHPTRQSVVCPIPSVRLIWRTPQPGIVAPNDNRMRRHAWGDLPTRKYRVQCLILLLILCLFFLIDYIIYLFLTLEV